MPGGALPGGALPEGALHYWRRRRDSLGPSWPSHCVRTLRVRPNGLIVQDAPVPRSTRMCESGPGKFVEPFMATPGVLNHTLLPDTQNAPRGGALHIWRRRRDSLGPSWPSHCVRTLRVRPNLLPANLSNPLWLRQGFSPTPCSQIRKTPHKGALCVSGGEGGIRTLGTVQHRTLAFQASPFDHSGTSPGCFRYSRRGWRRRIAEGRQF